MKISYSFWLVIWMLNILVPISSFANDLKTILKDLTYGKPQDVIQKTMGNPSEKDSESWVYETPEGSAKPRIEVGWKSGKLEYALVQPIEPVEVSQFLSSETKGLAAKKESAQNLRLGKRTFLVPDQGLRLTFSPANQVVEVMVTNPWPEKTKHQTLAAFLKSKPAKPLIQKQGARK